MSAMVTTIRRSPSVRAGVFGAILGATLALGIIFVLTGITTQADRGPGTRAVGSSAAALGVQAALRAHLAREYGSIGGTSPDVQAALRAHLAREYRADLAASPSLDVQAALRAHLAREYGQ